MSLYNSSKRISASLLNSLTNPRLLWLRKTKPELFESEEDTHLRLGIAVDTLLTSPQEWNDRFTVVDAYKPSGAMSIFIRSLPKGLTQSSPTEAYMRSYELSGYKRPIEWVINALWSNPKNVEYYEALCEVAEGKMPLSKDEMEQVIKCVQAIEENEFARRFFLSEHERIFQPRIEFDIITATRTVPCTAVLDGILVNHQTKEIEPFDLKTTSRSVWDFPSSFINNGYFRQAAFYTTALWAEKSPVRKYLDEGYTIKPFTFIVVETKPNAYGPVILYEMSDEWVDRAFNGFCQGDRCFSGINDLIEDFYWHVDNDVWYVPRAVYESKGRVPLT